MIGTSPQQLNQYYMRWIKCCEKHVSDWYFSTAVESVLHGNIITIHQALVVPRASFDLRSYSSALIQCPVVLQIGREQEDADELDPELFHGHLIDVHGNRVRMALHDEHEHR